MNNKFLSIVMCLASVSAVSKESHLLPEAWHNLHYGDCYRSLEQGMTSIYGAGYQADENITQEKLTFMKVKMVLSADTTSGTNAPRTIFELRPHNLWCVVLSSPPVAQIVQQSTRKKMLRPSGWETLTQAEPGYDEVKVVYLWDAAKTMYFPTHCFHISKVSLKEFSCTMAYQ